MDLKGHIIFVNRSACDIMGSTEGDVYKGLSALAMVAPEDREQAAATMQVVARLATGTPSSGRMVADCR